MGHSATLAMKPQHPSWEKVPGLSVATKQVTVKSSGLGELGDL